MERPTPNREGWIITNSNFKESELMRFHGIFLTKEKLPPSSQGVCDAYNFTYRLTVPFPREGIMVRL